MNYKIMVLILFYLFATVHFSYSLEEVGKIISVSGHVTFDIQGKNAFIQSQAGDVLYDRSAVKTGTDGCAVIMIGMRELKIPADTLIQVTDLLHTDSRNQPGNETIIRQLLQSLSIIIRDNFIKIEKKGKGRLESQSLALLPGQQYVREKDIDTEADKEIKEALRNSDYQQALLTLQKEEKSAATANLPRSCYALQALCYFYLGNYQQADNLFRKSCKQLDNEAVYAETAMQNEIVILNNLSSNQWETKGLYPLLAGISFFMQNDQSAAISYFRNVCQLEANNELKAYASYFLCLALIKIGAKADAKTYLERTHIEYNDVLLHREWQRLLKVLAQ